MSIISNIEEWETKKGTYAGVPGMKLHLGPVPAAYPELAKAELYESRHRYKCNVYLNEEQQEEVTAVLTEFAEKYIAAVTAKGLNKGDPNDPIKMQWKAKSTREGLIPVVTENGDKILKVETWSWAEEGAPREAPKCWRKNDEDKLVRVPHTKAIWGNGSVVSICGGVAVTYDKQKFNWVVKFMLSAPNGGGGEVLAHKVLRTESEGESQSAFGEVAQASEFGEAAEEEEYEATTNDGPQQENPDL